MSDLYEFVRKACLARLHLLSAEGSARNVLQTYINDIEVAATLNSKVTALTNLASNIRNIDYATPGAPTLAESRAIFEIGLIADIGFTDNIKLDGSTSKTLAENLGFNTLIGTTPGTATQLVTEINKIGDISTLNLDGSSTGSSSLVAALGTNTTLTTSDKTCVVKAINELLEIPNLVGGVNDFAICDETGANTVHTINKLVSSDRPITVMDKAAQCLLFANSADTLHFDTAGTCSASTYTSDVTDPGYTFVTCINTLAGDYPYN